MLALIAGQGRLPEIIADAVHGVHVVAMQGFEPESLKPDRVFRMEHLGSLLQELREAGATEVCFAGVIRRPAIDQSQVDAGGKGRRPGRVCQKLQGGRIARGMAKTGSI